MFLVHGAAWLDMKTEGAVRERVRRAGRRAFVAYVASWVAVTLLSRASAPHLWGVYERTAAAWLADEMSY